MYSFLPCFVRLVNDLETTQDGSLFRPRTLRNTASEVHLVVVQHVNRAAMIVCARSVFMFVMPLPKHANKQLLQPRDYTMTLEGQRCIKLQAAHQRI